MKLIECVPNFSEGRNQNIIKLILDSICSVDKISLLDVDSGHDTNRTVVTFVGEPELVIESAFLGIKIASELIDMNKHSGEHSRMGATDVCPLVPISNVSMEDCIKYSNILAEKVAKELQIPIYLYENSAKNKERKNLANIRKGEYEGLKEKLKQSNWKADYGPNKPHETAGATAIGAREFLIAYNININSQDKKLATDIALDIREQGRNKRDLKGKFIRDSEGVPIKKPGLFKHCKAVGWYIEEYGIAQVSMNLTNYKKTPLHKVFDTTCKQARKKGARVTGSEIVGLLPLETIINAGKYFLNKQKRSTGIPINDIINIAIKSMGLDELSPFDPKEKIIEYKINNFVNTLSNKKINDFTDILSTNKPAPGGGSASALAGALGASLSAMVSNLTIGKKKWDPIYEDMCKIGEQSQVLKDRLNILIDKDTEAFNELFSAFKLPSKTQEQIDFKNKSINRATILAIDIPMEILENCLKVLDIIIKISKVGNINSISDAGVAGEVAYAGARGGYLNVLINLKELNDENIHKKLKNKAEIYLIRCDDKLKNIRQIINDRLCNE